MSETRHSPRFGAPRSLSHSHAEMSALLAAYLSLPGLLVNFSECRAFCGDLVYQPTSARSHDALSTSTLPLLSAIAATVVADDDPHG